MARNELYTQCLLRRQIGEVQQEMISWIPADKAKKGVLISLKEWPSDEEWSVGWQVIEKYATKSGDIVEQDVNDYKIQRGASDI